MSLPQNISKAERIISLISGSYLLFRAIPDNKNKTSLLTGGYLVLRAATGYCPIYHGLASDSSQISDIDVATTITVNKSRQEVYSFWRQLDNLPVFMSHLASVEVLDQTHSAWKAKIPGGLGTFSWKARITQDLPDEEISWASIPDSAIINTGTVTFADAGKFGTQVHIRIKYRPPGMNVGAGVAKLLNPTLQSIIKEEIKDFRRYIESGEVPTIKGQASGTNK